MLNDYEKSIIAAQMMNSRFYFFNIILLTLFLIGSGCSQQREKKVEMTEEHYSMEDFKRVPKIDTHDILIRMEKR